MKKIKTYRRALLQHFDFNFWDRNAASLSIVISDTSWSPTTESSSEQSNSSTALHFQKATAFTPLRTVNVFIERCCWAPFASVACKGPLWTFHHLWEMISSHNSYSGSPSAFKAAENPALSSLTPALEPPVFHCWSSSVRMQRMQIAFHSQWGSPCYCIPTL